MESLALLALIAMGWLTYNMISGANPLPDRIPMHFDNAGHVNGWGSPNDLMILPGAAIGLYLLLSFIGSLPTAKVSVSQRSSFEAEKIIIRQKRVHAVAADLMGWMKAELMGVFLGIQWVVLKTIRGGEGATLPVAEMKPYFVGAMVCLFLTLAVHVLRMMRVAPKS